jgi:hypothetical protein
LSKFILDTHDITDGFFEDTRLLGIMAPMKDYQFCWQLNKMLGLDFRVNIEIEIQLKKKNRNYFFSVYEYHEPASVLGHYIYNNQYDGEYLLPEFRHFDFLWLMKGDPVSDKELKRHMENLRSISGVQLVAELTDEKIKNKEHLVF